MSTAHPIRLLVVDDHTLFRRGLVALLAADATLQVVGEAADGGEAVRRAGALCPDVVLLDNHLPGATGVQTLAGLLEASPGTRVVLLTVSEDEQDLQDALRGGASGYLLKTIEGDELSRALHRVMAGEAVVSPEMTGKLVAAVRHAGQVDPHEAALAQLSAREREVLQQIARGGSNKEIARALAIAETTVKVHVQNILRKLGLASRVQAAVFAARPAGVEDRPGRRPHGLGAGPG